MFAKLLKYDLKKQIKVFLIFDGLALLFAILARLLTGNNIAFVDILGKIFAGAMWAMAINSIVNTIIRAWANFSHSLYGDESYLIHTLPVKTSTIYWSKVLTVIIIFLMNIFAMIISVIITYGDTELSDLFLQLVQTGAALFGMTKLGFVGTFAALLFFEALTMIFAGFAGNIIGHKFNNRKTAYSILSGFGVYILVSLFNVICVLMVAIFMPELMKVFTESSISYDVARKLLYVCLGAYLLAVPMVLVGSAWGLGRGVEVE